MSPRREPRWAEALAPTLLAFAGITLALGGDLAQAPAGAWRGDLVMLAAAGCGAVYNVASRPLLRVYPPVAFTTQAMLAGDAMAWSDPAYLLARLPRWID